GGRQGARRQPRRGGAGDLLHRVEVHVEAGAGVTEGAAGDDFTPTGGQVADLLEHLGGELAARHGVSCLLVAEKCAGPSPSAFVGPRSLGCKAVDALVGQTFLSANLSPGQTGMSAPPIPGSLRER